MTPEGAAGTLPLRPSFPTLDSLPERLFPPLPTGVHWGLERTEAGLADVGDPQSSYAAIHIGGTNGKGSVAAMVAGILGEAGIRTGLYTSPHLCWFKERFQVAGRPVEEAALEESAAAIRPALERHGLTFFEATTVLAFHVFARLDVEVAVVEVGLGGRLDSTNVLRPEMAAVTNVALDHAEYLGDTPEQVAWEKGGIIKDGIPFVSAEHRPELVEIFRSIARERGSSFHRVDPARDLEAVEVANDHTSFRTLSERWGPLSLRTPLLGAHQAVNAALAVRIVELALDRGVDRAAVTGGIASVRWPGRLQSVEKAGATVIFDVAHNSAGTRALRRALDALDVPRPLCAVIGILGNKDWRSMLPPLFETVDRVWLTGPPSAPPERLWDPAEAVREVPFVPSPRIEADFRRCVTAALEEARGGTLLVTGSHHTVGDAMRLLGVDVFS